MPEKFDAVVIGAGPAGEVIAGELADGGMKVAICERELVAGECSFWACIPSKTLLRPGEVLSEASQAPGAKQAVTGKLDAAAAFAWRDFMVGDYKDADKVEWLDEKGIRLYRGDARIDGAGKVSANGDSIETERIVLATGSEPMIPPVDGLDGLEGI